MRRSADEEKRQSEQQELWQEQYQEHIASVYACVDLLEHRISKVIALLVPHVGHDHSPINQALEILTGEDT